MFNDFNIISKLIQFRARSYDKMLDGLTDENKQLLSTLVGQLATTRPADLTAAAREMDSKLTSQEKHTIGNARFSLENDAARAAEDLVERVLESGEKVTFPVAPGVNLTEEDPAMTLLTVSIEELITHLNQMRYQRPG